LFFAARILACCISPARSLAEPRNFQLEIVSMTLGTANAATTDMMNITSTSSTMVNPRAKPRRLQVWLQLFLIVFMVTHVSLLLARIGAAHCPSIL
jgi:hypothetical protein